MLAKKAQDVVQLSQWDLLYFTAVFNCCIFAPLSSHEVRARELERTFSPSHALRRPESE